MIVTTQELKDHLRILDDEEDALLTSLIAQAQEAVFNYCGTDWSGDGETVPETARLAVLLMASHFYEVRDSSDDKSYQTMMNAFHSLLYPNRKTEVLF